MAVMGAAPRFPVSRKTAKGRAPDSLQVAAGFLVMRRRGHRTSMRADSHEPPLHQVANVCTRLVAAISSSQVTGRLWPLLPVSDSTADSIFPSRRTSLSAPIFSSIFRIRFFASTAQLRQTSAAFTSRCSRMLRRLLAAAKPTGTVDDCGARRDADAGCTRKSYAPPVGPHFMYHLRSDLHRSE